MVRRRLAKEDAEKISIPHMVLASNGEDPVVVQEYKDIIEGGGKPGVVRILQLFIFAEVFCFGTIRANLPTSG